MTHDLLVVPCTAWFLAAATAQSGWSPPVLETALNTPYADSGMHLSDDGLTLHFSANAAGGASYDIYVATRQFPGGPWSAPALVSVSDPTVVDDQPFLSADGLELYFASTNRLGGVGSTDIW